MGITSSNLKENSDHKSPKLPEKEEGNGNGSSSGWIDRYEEYMKRGPCKKAYIDFRSGDSTAKKVDMCMEAHPDYYHILLAQKNAMVKNLEAKLEDKFMKDIMHSNIPLNEINDEELDKLFAKLKEEGCCKESFDAWAVNCLVSEEDAKEFEISTRDKKKNKDEVNCSKLFDQFCKCIDDHPNHPFFAFKKAVLEDMVMDIVKDMVKEYEILFSKPN